MMKDNEYSLGAVLLIVVNSITLIITNLINMKIFKVYDMILVCGILTYPITYIISDIIQEIYGYKLSRISNYIAMGSQFLFSIIGFLVCLIIPEDIYNNVRYHIILEEIFKLNFLSFMISTICSGVSDYINDIIFDKMKKWKDNINFYPIRAYTSSLAERLVDNILFGTIYLFFILKLPFKEVMLGNVGGFVMENIIEILLLPLSTYIVRRIQKYVKKIS